MKTRIFPLFLAFFLILSTASCAKLPAEPLPVPPEPEQVTPVPDPPVQEELPAEEAPEETPEEPPVETPPVEEAPEEPDLTAVQAEVEAFLQTQGVNGLICGGGNWPEEPLRLREVIYQLCDEAFTYDEVVAAYEADGGEVHTDLSYITSEKLDALLLSLTGYGLYEDGAISSRWNLQDVPYFAALDLYCIQHGDTNYQPFRAQVMDYNAQTHLAYVRLNGSIEEMSLFCYIGEAFTPCRYFDLVLARTDEKEFRILSIQPYVQ